MAQTLLLTALPENADASISSAARAAGFTVQRAADRDACREVLLNAQVFAVVIPLSLVRDDSRVLDEIRFCSNTVQIIILTDKETGDAPRSIHNAAAGILSAGGLTETAVLTALRNAGRLYGLEESIQALESDMRASRSVAQELDRKNKVLDRERNFNESIVSSIANGLLIVDTEGSVIRYNDMGRRIFGIRSPDAFGLPYTTIVYEEIRESLSADAREVIDTGRTKVVDGLSVKEDLIISYTVSLIRDNLDNPMGLLFLGRDVTEWEHMTGMLFQAEKLATMGTMLSGIAHELRNPLTIINARAQRLLSGTAPVDDKHRKAVESIEAQSRRCGEILNNLLDFSRKKVSGFTIANINELLENALGYLGYDRKLDDLDVVKHFDQGCLARCDKNQIEQAFLNLLTNACDVMDNRGRLTLTTEKAGNYIRISVRDTGPGIADDHKKKLFDPFFTTKEAGRGTGLGLALVYRAVQMHKGRLVVQSKPGAGSTFVIILPKA